MRVMLYHNTIRCEHFNWPAEAAILDGWFHTGDMATRDDGGFYFIVDRCAITPRAGR
jgi:acyl-CoA synthetase (AMP-forming)/AMP-acid ligase II